MPWPEATRRLARAVAHGFKPSGSAKGFSKDFASQVLAESKGKTLGEYGRRKRKKRKD